MSEWPLISLGNLFDIARGGSPRPIDKYITDDPNGVNWIMISDATDSTKFISKTKRKITQSGVSRSRIVKPGDFLLTNSMSFGRPYIMATTGCIHDGWLVLSPKTNNVDPDYFYHLLGSDAVYSEFEKRAAGATVKNLNIDLVKSVEIPLPPLDEQKRIAAILDQADSLGGLRQRSLDRLNTLSQAIFYEMFGDPAINPKGWNCLRLGDLSDKFSDGPFGSNLKSSHYVDEGIRIIRLQNIGVGEFVDDDQAFISESHFSTIKKHECLPGDILVGTMGSPNLRACILPDFIGRALNKADCVQIRANERIATSAYICSLLNAPSTEKMAHDLILGQTRARISMGRLRELKVPVPPKHLQLEYSVKIARVERIRAANVVALESDATLFASLQHRAFRGEL